MPVVLPVFSQASLTSLHHHIPLADAQLTRPQFPGPGPRVLVPGRFQRMSAFALIASHCATPHSESRIMQSTFDQSTSPNSRVSRDISSALALKSTSLFQLGFVTSRRATTFSMVPVTFCSSPLGVSISQVSSSTPYPSTGASRGAFRDPTLFRG